MCRQFTHYSFSICAHTHPIPQAFPFYVPPQYCSTVTDALNHYHTQPDRMPEQFPMPFPRPCPTEASENITLVVLGICDRCAVERRRRGRKAKIAEVPDGKETTAEGGGKGEVVHGQRQPEVGGATNTDADMKWVQRPCPGEWKQGNRTQLVNETKSVGERKDDEKTVKAAKGPVIVTTPEVVGAWWVQGTSMKCEGWTTDKNGKRQATSVTIWSGLTASASN